MRVTVNLIAICLAVNYCLASERERDGLQDRREAKVPSLYNKRPTERRMKRKNMNKMMERD